MRTIVFRKPARVEFANASVWYESQRIGLGFRFVDAVNELILRIAKSPERYPIVFEQIREAIVPRFPYCVYFEASELEIIVVAVFHSSRDPWEWKRRT